MSAACSSVNSVSAVDSCNILPLLLLNVFVVNDKVLVSDFKSAGDIVCLHTVANILGGFLGGV